jgi:D-alanyl-lipoteichoic acid acyltransferase DltB (MBOAT superfamily)
LRFNSFVFLLFLPVVAAILALLPVRWRKWWLLVASYAFYASWHYPYLALLFAVAALNHFGARWIIAGENRARRGALVLTGNILLLALFKYLDWLVGNVNVLSSWLGYDLDVTIPHWVLPLGISFYVFEAISYTVDVIRKRERLHGFWDFQLFIAFFPKLIAGPIMRAKELLPQVEKGELRPNAAKIQEGLWLLASGLFIKLVLANDLGSQVDSAFARASESFGAADVWLMAVAFGLQIYFDFSSYTRMAIGSAKLLGIELVENFDYPYSARSPVEFWNRWHMSLSRWIRDYLFFPLLGTKPTLWSMCRAALIAMALCGLWHGAGWTYILWGLYHGLLICGVHVATFGKKPPVKSHKTQGFNWLLYLRGFGAMIATFALVSLGWILFRSQGISQAASLLARAVQPWGFSYRALAGSFYAKTVALVFLVWLAPLAAQAWKRFVGVVDPAVIGWRDIGVNLAQGIAIGTMVVLSLVYFHGQTEFIYFQF